MNMEHLSPEFKADFLCNIGYHVVKLVRKTSEGNEETIFMATIPSEEAPVCYDSMTYAELVAHPHYIDTAFEAMCTTLSEKLGIQK
ncbi:MAG: hypothetical protein II222_00080 [Paraprevotella sp.]|nr:hypothetical protein [Paraprevotella sp.]